MLAKISFISSFKTQSPIKPCLPATSTLVKGVNLVSFHFFLLFLICLNGDSSLPSTHADSFSLELTQTRDLSFFPTSSDKLCVAKRGKRACRFTYLFLPERQAGRQSGMSMCGSAASDWCEITVTAARSVTTNAHKKTLPVGEVL